MRFLELLSDEELFRKLKLALYAQALSDKLDTIMQTTASLIYQLETRNEKLPSLKDRLEGECDNLEQYSRRSNLRFCGIFETGADTTAKVVEIVYTKMPPPPVSQEDIVIRFNRI